MSDITDRLTPAIADRYRIEGELGQGGMTPRGDPIIKEGVNHLILIKEDDRWRIMAIAW